MMPASTLAAHGLGKRYGAAGFRAVIDVTLRIGAGEFVSIIGRSGSGKSTLLAMLGALMGVGGAYSLFNFGDIAKMTNGIFITFEVTRKIVGIGLLVAAGLGVIASIGPSISVARMSVVNGLKTLD